MGFALSNRTIKGIAVNGICVFPLCRAAIIIIAAISTPIAKSQHLREIWFYVMSGGVILKIAVMELARIIQMF